MAVWVGILTVIGAVIRFWKIEQGLPFAHFSDEALYVYDALNMGGGDLNTHHFAHPGLYFYLLFFVDVLYILFGLFTGQFARAEEAWQLYKTDPTVFYVIARGVTGLFGVLTIPLVYLFGKKVFNERIGFLASFFVTFAYLHIQFSQVGNMDVIVTFWILLALLFAFGALEKGRNRDFILSGFVAGIAGTTKFQGLETLLWGPLLCGLRSLKETSKILSGKAFRQCLLFISFFVLAFTFGTPFWVLDFPKFKEDFLWQWSVHNAVSGTGQIGAEGNYNWFYYLFTAFPYGVGIPLEAAGFLGMFILAFRPNLRNTLFLFFPLVYFLIGGSSKIRAARYIIPMIPFLCLAAAHFLDRCFVRMNGVKRKARSYALAGFAGFLVILPCISSVARYSYLRRTPDTRNLAWEWIQEHVSPQDKILQSFYTFIPNLPQGPAAKLFDQTAFSAAHLNRSELKTLDEYRREGFRYLILDDWHLGTVLVEASQNARRRETVQRYERFLEELESSGELLAAFSPYRGKELPFDAENIELPSRNLWKLKSFGPLIKIYKL